MSENFGQQMYFADRVGRKKFRSLDQPYKLILPAKVRSHPLFAFFSQFMQLLITIFQQQKLLEFLT